MSDKKPFYEQVAEKLIEQLKEGVAPWQKPWEPGHPGSFIPMNPTTGKRYKGINAVQLMSQGRTDPRWMTYKQAQAEGYQVRRGEKGTPIQYWKFSEERALLDEHGMPVLDPQGNALKKEIRLERPRVFSATVFNAEQIEGVPPIEPRPVAWSPMDRAESILKSSGASISHNGGDRAFYRLATDSIHLPDRGQFAGADRYYAVALHELGHWTGHSSRLDRDLAHPFGSEGYAKEELRAEIASMILGDELGIGHDPGRHAAYVANWIKILKDDPLEVFRAAAAAEKIQEFVLSMEQKLEQRETQAETLNQTEERTMANEPIPAEVTALREEIQQVRRTAFDFQELGETAESAAEKYNGFLRALEKTFEPFAESIDAHHAVVDADHYLQERWEKWTDDNKLSELLRMQDRDIAAFIKGVTPTTTLPGIICK